MTLNKFYTANQDRQPTYLFASVAEVDETKGVRLLFDGTTIPTQKYYVCATNLTLAVGDRVKVCKDSGTYIVEYKLGLPGAETASFSFQINGVTYSAKENQSWSNWVGSRYNTAGFFTSSVSMSTTFYFLTLNGQKVATINGTAQFIIPNHNYTLLKGSFKINGTNYECYQKSDGTNMTAYEWCTSNNDLNPTYIRVTNGTPSGYTTGYYFCTSSSISTAIAKFSDSTYMTPIIEGHNYTMNG